MRMFLTGARGQVGQRALQYWSAQGADVLALTRVAPPADAHPNVTWVQGDLDHPSSLDAVSPFPTTVVFTAAITHLPQWVKIFARRGVTRIIAFSSTSVHTKKDSGNPLERELVESLQQSEATVFAAAKQHTIAVTILRPTMIYGIGADKNVSSIARVMRRLPFFPIPLNTSGLRQPVHADDLAAATYAVANSPATYGKAYDVGGGEQLTYHAFLKRIAVALNKNILLLPIPAFALLLDIAGKLIGKPTRIHGEIARRMGEDMVFDDSAARRDFHWQPRAFLDASRQPTNISFF